MHLILADWELTCQYRGQSSDCQIEFDEGFVEDFTFCVGTALATTDHAHREQSPDEQSRVECH